MKKYILLLFAAASLLTTSCIDIIEKIHFNKDGSGHMTYILDMSKLKSFTESMKDENGEGEDDGGDNMKKEDKKGDKKMSKSFEEYKTALSSINGISNVKFDDKKADENYIFEIGFDFKDFNALNEAMTSLKKSKNSMEKSVTYISGTAKKITRSGSFFNLSDKNDDEESENDNPMLQSMLKDSKYRMIYTFDKTIKKVSNDKAIVSENKKEMTIEYSLVEMMKDNNDLSAIIKLKK